ncbi:MAG: F0F1 ATP synthase subunit alpha, partial [Anaerolineae bacterium]
SDLDEATRRQLDRGLRVQEVLKQGQYDPVPLADQIIIFYAVTNGFLDDVEIRKVSAFGESLLRYMKDSQPALVQTIATGEKLSEETQAALNQAIDDFKATVAY